ncbi:GNAT family N-acetyltransferase [Bacillus lacus]|uniref:GNAT family N-acetyltransferase n=1 Tax=Metabacillus lacus TaxID=1983721 RepID=A0A7X2IXN5_9BACI|nr:GNAT family N-acetyltransferase [Metabacillus lacus]MRX71700.1 GNAT family N-acetyltransferase [Metabacillus lacus]
MIRELDEKDYQKAIQLSEYAFQYKVTEEELQKRRDQLKNHIILADEEEGEITSKLHIIPFQMHWHGNSVRMGGIAGVATFPEYRRMGKVNRLLTDALKRMRQEGMYLSYLHPFHTAFYRQFGWELVSSRKIVSFSRQDLVRIPSIKGTVRRHASKNMIAELKRIYSQFAIDNNSLLDRDDSWWENTVIQGAEHAAIAYSTDYTPLGYLLYEVKNKKFIIREGIFLEEEAKKLLWNYTAQHDSMVDGAEWVTHEKDEFTYYLHNPDAEVKVKPYAMGRIVDAEAILKAFPFHLQEQPLILHIHDSHAPWNNGTFMKNKEKADFFRQENEGAACAHPPKRGLTLDIGTLTALLSGYKDAEFLYRAGLMTGSLEDAESLSRCIPAKQSILFDFF